MNGAPSADSAGPLLVHGAEAVVFGPAGKRRIPLEGRAVSDALLVRAAEAAAAEGKPRSSAEFRTRLIHDVTIQVLHKAVRRAGLPVEKRRRPWPKDCIQVKLEEAQAMKTAEVHVTVNGTAYEKTVPCNQTLLRFLREDLYLTSVKEDCDEGECGACTVLLDECPVNSCLVLAAELDGREILTAEGLAEDGRLHPLQEAFIEAGAVQCGYCTPGMLISGIALLNRYPHPTRAQIRKEMEGNICRCTGYTRIADAVLLAVEKMDAARAEARAAGLPEPEFRGIDSRFSEKWNRQYQS